MTIRKTLIALSMTAGVGLAGCTTTTEERGAVTGAAVGGAGGAIVGALVDRRNPVRGAIIGGGAGAVAGAVIGANEAKQRGYPYDARAGCYYNPSTGVCVAYQ